MEKVTEVALAVKSWLATQGLKINDVAERLGVSAQAVTSQARKRAQARVCGDFLEM